MQMNSEYTSGMNYRIGSRVRVKLYNGQIVEAEIVVIFTASVGKNILVASPGKFVRVSPEQIIAILQ
jgi:hypothetical protein